jgi:hypothetical protein
MRTQSVVKVEISAQRRAGLCDRVVGLEVDLFVFHAAPQPLDEDVVALGAFAVHADGDLAIQQDAGERLAARLSGILCVGPYLQRRSATMAIKKGTLDELLAGRDPQAVFSVNFHRNRTPVLRRKGPPPFSMIGADVAGREAGLGSNDHGCCGPDPRAGVKAREATCFSGLGLDAEHGSGMWPRQSGREG